MPTEVLNEPWARPLIASLSGGEFLSGETLAQDAGISRVAIWKRIERLQQAGVPIITQRGRGYCIEGGMDLLDEKRIRAQLLPGVAELLTDVRVLLSTESTNADAQRDCRDGQCKAFLAEMQTAGRGRRGRQWVSPFGANLYLSICWRFTSGAAALEGLSLAVGVAIGRLLRELGVEPVRLKWPNDIVTADGRKLGGILIEMSGDLDGPVGVIVGIGLNYELPTMAATEITQPWADLAGLLPERIERSRFAAALLNNLIPLLAAYESEPFEHYHRDWDALDALAGESVVLHLPLKSERGIARGVTSTGQLLIEIDGKVQQFSGGEVSVRKVADAG